MVLQPRKVRGLAKVRKVGREVTHMESASDVNMVGHLTHEKVPLLHCDFTLGDLHYDDSAVICLFHLGAVDLVSSLTSSTGGSSLVEQFSSCSTCVSPLKLALTPRWKLGATLMQCAGLGNVASARSQSMELPADVSVIVGWRWKIGAKKCDLSATWVKASVLDVRRDAAEMKEEQNQNKKSWHTQQE